MRHALCVGAQRPGVGDRYGRQFVRCLSHAVFCDLQRNKGKLSAKSPQYVARKGLAAVAKNKRICIPGFWNKAIARVPKLVPLSWRMHFIARRWRKLEKDAF